MVTSPVIQPVTSPVHGSKLNRPAGRGGLSWLYAAYPTLWDYDPADLTTQYDATGQQVTAVGQAVTLVLDKSKNRQRSANMALNGGFDSGANWALQQPTSGSVSIGGGTLRINSVDGSACWAVQVGTGLVQGGVYEVEFDLVSNTGAGVRVDMGTSVGNLAFTTPGRKRTVVVCGSTPSMQFTRVGITDTVVDNVTYKEILGSHLQQNTAGSRWTLSARVNLLQKTEQFADAIWVSSLLSGRVNASDGSSVSFSFTASATAELAQNIGTNAVSTAYVISGEVRSATAKKFRLKLWTGVAVLASADITPTADWQQFSFTTIATTLTNTPNFSILNEVGAAAGGPIEVRKCDIRTAADAAAMIPPYQRVTTPTDHDTVGFPLYFLSDGVDDGMATINNVNAATTDKATLFAAVTKLSDAAVGVIAELGASSALAGGLGIFGPGSAATGNYSARSTGSISATPGSASTFAAPHSGVVTLLADIAGDFAQIRVNGVAATAIVTDQGTGNYAVQRLNVGKRDVTGTPSLPFNGRIYRSIGVGAAMSAAHVQRVERQLGVAMGITI